MWFQKYLDPKNDLAFKKIFGQEKHKKIPIAFLNAVFNLEGADEIIDLTFLSPVQLPEIQMRKESIVDVLVQDQKGSKYVIEMQVANIYREGFKNWEMARRRPEFESGAAGVEAAQPERLGDADGSQIQWLPDDARTNF